MHKSEFLSSKESGSKNSKPFFQPKLSINQPNDVYEQEADAVAEQVLQTKMNNQADTFFKPINISTVQRKCAACEQEEEEMVQRKQDNMGIVNNYPSKNTENSRTFLTKNLNQGTTIQRQLNPEIDEEILHTEEEFSEAFRRDPYAAEYDMSVEFPLNETVPSDWQHTVILNYLRRAVDRIQQTIGNDFIWNWERWVDEDYISTLGGTVLIRTRDERNEYLRNIISVLNEWIQNHLDTPLSTDANESHSGAGERLPSYLLRIHPVMNVALAPFWDYLRNIGYSYHDANLIISYIINYPSYSPVPGRSSRSYATGRELLVQETGTNMVRVRYLSTSSIRDTEIIIQELRDSNGRYFMWNGTRVYDTTDGWSEYRDIEVLNIHHESTEEETEIRRKPVNETGSSTGSELENYIESISNRGNALPTQTNQYFSQKIGYDFSNVKIHTDSVAAKSAQSINALAYTTGNHIVFNQNQFQPETDTGKKLLAHELTHVVQQSGNISAKKIQRTIGDGHDLTSPRFSGNTELEDVYDGVGFIEQGDTGDAVSKVQHALVDFGVMLSNFGIDGLFENETKTAVTTFQTRRSIAGDPVGKVGVNTLTNLDNLYPSVVTAGAGGPFSYSCMRDYMCPWNSALINDLHNFNVFTADEIFWEDQEFDGSAWNIIRFEGGGSTNRATRKIIIANKPGVDTCQVTCGYLYHEYQHGRIPSRLSTVWGGEENYAYRTESMWSAARAGSSTMGMTATTATGEIVIDQSAVDATVESYPGVTVGSNETVRARIGATQVRVQREDGSTYVRDAIAGDSVPDTRPPQTTNEIQIPDSEFHCP